MALADLLTNVVEYVGEAIVTDCGRPTPTKVLRYHGTQPGLPQDCCTDDGVLSIGWAMEYPTDNWPNPSRGDSSCPGPLTATLAIHYDVCWSIPDADASGIEITDALDAKWDADAAMLADVAECVGRALVRLACGTATGTLAAAIFGETGCKRFQFQNVTADGPGGGCARLTWRCWAGTIHPAGPS